MKLSNRTKRRLFYKYGPWALVTGASSGIGREICRSLAQAGFQLVINGRNDTALRNLSEELEEKWGIRTKVLAVDISTTTGVNQLLAGLSDLPIGLFVASAGFGTSGEFIASHLETEVKMVYVNTLSLMMLTHYFAQKFSNDRRGGIILMSSIVGFQGVPNSANYAATKSYVQALGEALYHELKPYGVHVLTAAPGPVSSGFAQVANLQMGNALKPKEVVVPILKALGRKSTVFPGRLTKILILGLRTVPRWGKIRIMKQVMGGMTKHQTSRAKVQSTKNLFKS